MSFNSTCSKLLETYAPHRFSNVENTPANIITILGREQKVEQFVGKVVFFAKRAVTVQTGSNSSSTIHGNNISTSTKISNSTTIYDDIIIQDENGKELALQLADWNLTCREGNIFHVIWVMENGELSNNEYALIHNRSTNKFDFGKKFFHNSSFGMIGLGAFLLCIGLFFSFVSSGAPSLFSAIFMSKTTFVLVPTILYMYFWSAWADDEAIVIEQVKRKLKGLLLL